jgi:transposase
MERTGRSPSPQKLDRWLKEADASDAEVMKRFSAGLKKDLAAVRAGLTERWSTGPVEGFIDKLELLKRQGELRPTEGESLGSQRIQLQRVLDSAT